MEYNAILTREGDAVLVSFPDCPGCQTFGRDEAEALEMAADALDGWLRSKLSLLQIPPRPSSEEVPVAPNQWFSTVAVEGQLEEWLLHAWG